ncbi:MAG: hypothetical protein KDD42_02405, partial [Bdellovibrionales bacterium]|nr:hypothetical protein [Bdellovibrionales bacterium]
SSIKTSPQIEVATNTEADFAEVLEFLRECISDWTFLSPEQEKLVRSAYEALEVPAYDLIVTELEYVPTDYLIVHFQFISDNPAERFPQVDSLLQSGLGTLQKRLQSSCLLEHLVTGVSGESNTPAWVSIYQGGIDVEPSRTIDTDGLLTEAERQAIWEFGLAVALQTQHPNVNALEQEKLLAESKLKFLADFYSVANMPELSSLARAMVFQIYPSLENLRRYRDADLIDLEHVGAPVAILEIVNRANQVASRLPSAHDLEERAERCSEFELGPVISWLLRFEQEAKIVSDRIAEVAEIELQDAVRYARESSVTAEKLEVTEAAEVIRAYFESYFQNVYTVRAGLEGISKGMVSRESDCSMRALLAQDFFLQMGINAGVEVIQFVDGDGRINNDVLGHVYNYVENGGERIYFDFSRNKSGPFIFYGSADPIKRHYYEDLDRVRVTFASDNPTDIIGEFVTEPIRDKQRKFQSVFRSDPKSLSDLLHDHPELLNSARDLYQAQLALQKLFPNLPDQAALWRDGSIEAMRRLFEP